MTPDHIIAGEAILGEGIQWRDGALWWTDIQASLLHACTLADSALQTWRVPERLGSFAHTGDKDLLLCAFETGFADYRLSSGDLAWRARLETLGSGIRFNDGRVDRRGRFWAGTMVEGDTAPQNRLGALYCLDGVRRASAILPDVEISNGLAWSPDGRSLYFADSSKRVIWRFDVDPDTGFPVRRSVFAETPPGIYPDGATVDADGCYWSAQWGGSRVVRYRPDGTVDTTILLPASQPTCLCFGGPDLSLLCITTAREGLSPTQRQQEPLAGSLLIYNTNFCGLAEMAASAL